MSSVFNDNGNKKYFEFMTFNLILGSPLLHKKVNITLIFNIFFKIVSFFKLKFKLH